LFECNPRIPDFFSALAPCVEGFVSIPSYLPKENQHDNFPQFWKSRPEFDKAKFSIAAPEEGPTVLTAGDHQAARSGYCWRTKSEYVILPMWMKVESASC